VHHQVRHPGVSGIIRCDFVLMQRAARLCSLLPGLAELRLDESIRQFGGPLKEQVWSISKSSSEPNNTSRDVTPRRRFVFRLLIPPQELRT
jgi:hypothetical protein